MQLEHHGEAVRAGRKPDNTIETRTLRPLARANLQEALRAVAAAQTRLPRAFRRVAQPLTRRSAGCRYLFLFRPSCRAGLRGAARNRLPTGVPRAARRRRATTHAAMTMSAAAVKAATVPAFPADAADEPDTVAGTSGTVLPPVAPRGTAVEPCGWVGVVKEAVPDPATVSAIGLGLRRRDACCEHDQRQQQTREQREPSVSCGLHDLTSGRTSAVMADAASS